MAHLLAAWGDLAFSNYCWKTWVFGLIPTLIMFLIGGIIFCVIGDKLKYWLNKPSEREVFIRDLDYESLVNKTYTNMIAEYYQCLFKNKKLGFPDRYNFYPNIGKFLWKNGYRNVDNVVTDLPRLIATERNIENLNAIEALD